MNETPTRAATVHPAELATATAKLREARERLAMAAVSFDSSKPEHQGWGRDAALDALDLVQYALELLGSDT